MSRDAPVGVFDSGMGGLAVAACIARDLPSESILYLGDVEHRPFGPRTAAEVAEYARAAEAFFQAQGAKAMVIACNTASVVADRLRGLLPVVEMVGPAVAAAAELRPRSIAVLGTSGTVASGVYQRALAAALPGTPVVARACECALRLAERGGGDDQALLERRLGECLEAVVGYDVAILACTDFTCVRATLDRVNAGRLRLLDPAEAVAAQLRRLLEGRGLLSASTRPRHRFCVTAPEPAFPAIGRGRFRLPVEMVELVRTEVRT
ncbi:MAG TPA: aspartate/glutamate racemase family protein [Candidatus Dormibacteraeota bacterium]|nr:aspartate/glutamate racemase family protein [Candidatus Dormibacteraeota bacterium]